MIKKIHRKNYLEATVCILLVAIVMVTFIQVLFRYLLHLSLAWSEELARYLFLWLAAFTSAYAFKTRSHFVLRFFVDLFGKRIQRFMGTVVVFVMSGFMILFIWKAIAYTITVASQTAPSLRISIAFPYSSAVVGGILMLYYIIKNWWVDIHKPLKLHSKQEQVI